MRVEPVPYVYRNDDRRQRWDDRRIAFEDRRIEQPASPRARHAAHVWFAPAFGAHILGLIAPEAVMPSRAQRAYLQPEARTPLRPLFEKSA
jgi:tRNA U34 5-methylaminomethyl-2-thiouridine-forming methyltransferase MnmC